MARIAITNMLGRKTIKATGGIRGVGRYGEFIIGEGTVFITNENGAWIDIESREGEGQGGHRTYCFGWQWRRPGDVFRGDRVLPQRQGPVSK